MATPPVKYLFYLLLSYFLITQFWSAWVDHRTSPVTVVPLTLQTNDPVNHTIHKKDPFLHWRQDHWTPQRYPTHSDILNDNNDFIQNLQYYQQPGANSSALFNLVQQTPQPARLSTSVVIQATDRASLKLQLASLPAVDAVWIVHHPTDKAWVQKLVRASSSQVTTIASPLTPDGSAAKSAWLSVLPQLDFTSDYLWILDDGAVPSDQFLPTMVRLLDSDSPYHATLLGYHASLLPTNAFATSFAPAIHCLPAAFHFLPQVTQPVDMLHHTWVLQRSWLSALLAEQRPDMLASPLSYYLSQALANVGIPSIVLPPPTSAMAANKKSPHAFLTNVPTRLACHQVIPPAYDSNPAWRRLLAHRTHPTALDYRFRSITPSYKSLMFLVTSVDHAKVLFPLLCRFPDTVPVHVVLAGESAGLQGAYWSPLLAQECRRPFVVHDLDLEMVSLTAQLTSRLGRLVHAIQPTVFLHLEDSPYFDHVQAVVKSPGLLSPCTAIHLPSDQVAHALWLANLPIAALQHWNKIKVELVVITDRRPHSLSRLLSSLREAKYLGDRVDLAIHMDQTADKVTRMLVHSFRWIHGNTDLRHRIRKGGLMPAIVESWFPSSNDHYGVLLEDDIEVSPLFYVWIKYNILHYRYDPLFSNGRSWIYGISLYSPRNLELKPQGRVAFDPNDELLPSGYPARSPYASQVPCSWGAVYFPEHWREFHQYLTARLQDLDSPVPQLNTTVPQSRSNRWKKSWKKYFIELVYLRGYVMVYPNFQDFESFSTNHLEFGTHIKHTRAKSAVASFVVPLMRNDTIFSQLPDNRLPFFVELPMIDLWGNLRTHPQLYHTGVQWQRHVSACAPPSFIRFDPQDLLCPFDPPANAMASLTLDPLPMTMTNQQPTDVQSLPPPPTATVTAQRKPTKKKKVLTTQILEHMEFVTVYVDDDEASHVTDMDNAWDDQPVALDVAKMAGSMSDHFYEDDEFKDLEHSLAELAALANA